MRTLWKDPLVIVTLLGFLGLSGWWAILQVGGADDAARQTFAAVYGLMALWGALIGFRTAMTWGGLKSVFGKALLMFAIGLLLQEFGQLAYSYYIYYLHIDVPYPSLGDLGYFGSIPFYIYGALLLAHTAGVKFGIRSVQEKALVVILPVAMLAMTYLFFLNGHELDTTKPLTMFLDFGYPFGQSITISIALLTYVLSQKLLGGIMKSRIRLIILGFLVQYAADFMFLYQNSRGTWIVGGLNDYVYLLSYTVMTFALILLRHTFETVRKGST